MGWIPEQPMNPCPNPECAGRHQAHVDFYTSGNRTVAGWCPSCGIKGPRSSHDGPIEEKVATAVQLWNASFPDRRPLTAELVSAAVERQVAAIQDQDLVAEIRAHLVMPHCVDRPWDYGAVGATYPCWTVLERGPRALVYCLEGFGPKMPWGLVWADPASGTACSMGADFGWFSSLEQICAEEFFDEEPA